VDPIEYPDAIRDEATGLWVSRAEAAEIPFPAFASAKASEQVFDASRAPLSPTCHLGNATRTPRGSCSRSSHSTRA